MPGERICFLAVNQDLDLFYFGHIASSVWVIESTTLCSLRIPDGVPAGRASEKSIIAVPSGWR